MRDAGLRNVRERLLQAGLAPRHVHRYVGELQDHLSDLMAQARREGMSAGAAEERANALLGSDTQLVQAMLERCPQRSLAARAPWAAFGLLPVALLLLVTVLLAVASFVLFEPFQHVAPAAVPRAMEVVAVVITFIGTYALGPALATLCIIVAVRQRAVSAWVWAGLVVIALICGPLGVSIGHPAPGSGFRGSAIQLVWEGGRIDAESTRMWMLMRSAALFACSALALCWMRQRLRLQSA